MPTVDRVVIRENNTDSTYMISNCVEGYFYNGVFYKESTHTTVIDGVPTLLYLDLPSKFLYRYDNTLATPAYIQISKTGDMMAQNYDPDGDVATAGGIVEYVDDIVGDIETLLAAL